MDDVREVGAELHRLAEAEELDAFDSGALVQRGRRGRRRRKLLTAGGAVAGVAVVALAASVLPNLGGEGNQVGVAGHPGQSSLFEPVPGVPSGEAGAGQTITKAEAARRCALRYPKEKRPLQGEGDHPKSGQVAMYKTAIGEKYAVCTIPGGDKPTAALVAAAAKDPLPTTAAGQLRNCSVETWVDLTGWQLMAVDQSKRLATTSLVAVSPSGRKAVACQLGSKEEWTEVGDFQFLTLGSLDPNEPVLAPAKGSQHADLYAGGGGGGGFCPGTPCTNDYHFTGWGRVSSKATKVVLQLSPGATHTVPVKDGWFAVSWLTPGVGKFATKLTAYDKTGKIVKVIN
ncbi:hypothetical protein [Streptomyces sp. SID13031]|uniref:hypothetical protein n=1 Tax=Streptomyces sp. SID13031 TaxID=2706046 RepID=UPI0013CAC437|nr:hypothetical protein [Streptomyces sp. SID13031]NEA30633.1 hypothetical protein [Streptomyces sp. SID13031]